MLKLSGQKGETGQFGQTGLRGAPGLIGLPVSNHSSYVTFHC